METTPISQLGYDTKAASYFEEERPEMLPFVPHHCHRVLDVGCGCGGFGKLLKRLRGVEVWGVEPVRSAAEQAAGTLDHVIEGQFDSQMVLPVGAFDCVIFNDVLEHMIAPEMALQKARPLLAPGGVVVASIPNIRSLPTIWQLMVHARWKYEDCGVLDRTHIRFFTESTISEMFENEGYQLASICGLNAYRGIPNVRRSIWAVYKLFNALSLGKFNDMRYQQFAVVAKLRPECHEQIGTYGVL